MASRPWSGTDSVRSRRGTTRHAAMIVFPPDDGFPRHWSCSAVRWSIRSARRPLRSRRSDDPPGGGRDPSDVLLGAPARACAGATCPGGAVVTDPLPRSCARPEPRLFAFTRQRTAGRGSLPCATRADVSRSIDLDGKTRHGAERAKTLDGRADRVAVTQRRAWSPSARHLLALVHLELAVEDGVELETGQRVEGRTPARRRSPAMPRRR